MSISDFLVQMNQDSNFSLYILKRFYGHYFVENNILLQDPIQQEIIENNLENTITYNDRDNTTNAVIEVIRSNPKIAEKILSALVDEIDWTKIATSRKIILNPLIIETFEQQWDNVVWDFNGNGYSLWYYLAYNEKISWTTQLIKKYSNKFIWEGLSSNTFLAWDLKLIEDFFDKWDWEKLLKNSAIKWEGPMLLKFISNHNAKLLLDCVYISWTNEMFEAYVVNDNDAVLKLSLNERMIWDENKFVKALSNIGEYNEESFWENISSNKAVTWNQSLIEKYFNRWNWYKLSSNTAIVWSQDLLEKYQEKLSWNNLCLNEAIDWNESLIVRFSKKINWYILGKNKSVKWTSNILLSFLPYWDGESLANKNVYDNILKKSINDFEVDNFLNNLSPCTNEQNLKEKKFLIAFFRDLNSTIDESTDKTLFENLISIHFNFSDNSIQKYFHKINWRLIKNNKSLKISLPVRKYVTNRVDDYYWNRGFDDYPFHGLINLSLINQDKLNQHLPFFYSGRFEKLAFKRLNDYFLIEELENLELLDTNDIAQIVLSCLKNYNWKIEFLNEYQEKLNWDLLSLNEGLPFKEPDLITLFSEKWNWNNLSRNSVLPFSIEFFKKYEAEISWEDVSKNEGSFWNEEIIDAYSEKLNWYSLSENPAIKWNFSLISKYKDFVVWEAISFNPSLEFTFEILDTFKNELFWYGEDLEEVFAEDDAGRIIKSDWQVSGNGLSANSKFPWCKEYMIRYKDNLDWVYISYENKHIHWTKELIVIFKEHLSWSYLFDEVYTTQEKKGKSDFKHESEKISRLNIERSLILEHLELFDIKTLCSNENIDWTFELFSKIIYSFPTFPNIFLSASDNILQQKSKEESCIYPNIFHRDRYPIMCFKNIVNNKTIFEKVFKNYLSIEVVDRIL